jgi:hypothetical protein
LIIAFCGAETFTLRKVDEKCMGIFEMWCWKRMDKNGYTNDVKSEEVLHRIKEEKDILYVIKRRNANLINTKRPYSKLHINSVDG